MRLSKILSKCFQYSIFFKNILKNLQKIKFNSKVFKKRSNLIKNNSLKFLNVYLNLTRKTFL